MGYPQAGVEYLEISFWNQYTGQQVILGTASNAGPLSASWNTSGLTPAAYTVRAYAYDALGNWSQADISVTVASSTAESLKDSSISLAARVKVSRIAVIGNVYIKNSAGAAIANTQVTIRWTLPNGITQTAAATTGSAGRALFRITGPRGTYTLTVTGASKPG